VALKTDAAPEKSKDQLLRDFCGHSIFDFCNKIGHEADMARMVAEVRFQGNYGSRISGPLGPLMAQGGPSHRSSSSTPKLFSEAVAGKKSVHYE
jgi:hypothetical protein